MASRIETLRKGRHWSRRDLGTFAGVAEHTVIRAERSPLKVQARSLNKIATALGVPLDELLRAELEDRGLSTPPPPPPLGFWV